MICFTREGEVSIATYIYCLESLIQYKLKLSLQVFHIPIAASQNIMIVITSCQFSSEISEIFVLRKEKLHEFLREHSMAIRRLKQHRLCRSLLFMSLFFGTPWFLISPDPTLLHPTRSHNIRDKNGFRGC